jgi:hypothetical protein
VVEQDQRLLAALGFKVCDEVGAAGGGAELARFDAFVLKNRSQEVGRQFFVAGWVRGVDADIALQELRHLRRNIVPIDAGRSASCG